MRFFFWTGLGPAARLWWQRNCTQLLRCIQERKVRIVRPMDDDMALTKSKGNKKKPWFPSVFSIRLVSFLRLPLFSVFFPSFFSFPAHSRFVLAWWRFCLMSRGRRRRRGIHFEERKKVGFRLSRRSVAVEGKKAKKKLIRTANKQIWLLSVQHDCQQCFKLHTNS